MFFLVHINKKWFLTLSSSKVLAGHVGDVTVKSRPSHFTVANPGGFCLRTGAAIVTADLAAHVYKVLREERKVAKCKSYRDKKIHSIQLPS